MQPTQTTSSDNTRNRGFASMNSERQREIARKGGKAAHEKGTAHEFTSDEAREAGRKGGERVSADRSHMSRIGRRGGQSSAGRRQLIQPRDNPAGDDIAQPRLRDGADRVAEPADEMASVDDPA